MPVSDLIRTNGVAARLSASDVGAALNEMVELLASQKKIWATDVVGIVDALVAREAMSPTAMDYGFALPHALDGRITRVSVSLGISPKGLLWDVCSDERVHIVLLMLAPVFAREEKQLAQKRLAEICRKCLRRGSVLRDRNPADLLALIASYEEAQGWT